MPDQAKIPEWVSVEAEKLLVMYPAVTSGDWFRETSAALIAAHGRGRNEILEEIARAAGVCLQPISNRALAKMCRELKVGG